MIQTTPSALALLDETWPFLLLGGGVVLGWFLARRREAPAPPLRPTPGPDPAEELEALREAYPGIRYRLLEDGTVLERSEQPGEFGDPDEDSSVGHRLHDLVTEEDRGPLAASLARALESGQPQTVEYGLKSAKEERHFEGRLMPRPDGSCLLYARDVSARRKAAEEHAELEKRLRQLFRMEALGQLAGGVAHDFNNILTVITGHSQLIREQVEEGHAALEDLDQIDIASEGAAGLTRRLLSFSRDNDLDPEWVDINRVVRRIHHMLDRLLRDDIELHLELDDDVWHVCADEGSLEQVLVNLALNAGDAMATGGSFTIETRNVVLQPEDLEEAPELEAGRFVCITVSDTGHGMSAEVQQRAFEPFFTTKTLGRGTGLGLASAYGIVHKSQGFIKLESEVGVGTAFRIFMPASLVPREDYILTPRIASLAGRETILLCDDDAGVSRVMCECLSSSGYQVLVAKTAEEALQIEDEFEDPLHLLVTDVVMARISGGQLTEILRERRPGLRVLFVSGYPQEVVLHHCTLTEDDGYLPKPFTPRELLERVRKVLDRGSARIWT